MSTADRYVAALAELAAITKERDCLDNYTRKLTKERDEAQSQVDLWEKQHTVACEHWGAIEAENARLREHLDEALTESSEWGVKYIATVDHLTIELAAVTAERDEALGALKVSREAVGDVLEENDRLRAQLADVVTKENERLRYCVSAGEATAMHLRERAKDAEAENARLRAAIAPTAENVVLHRQSCQTRLFTDSEVIGFLTAIAARAGVKL